MIQDRLVTTARALAASDHRAAGGTGEPPADLVQKHAAALAIECEKQSTPGVRQAPAMQPTNGTHPDDSPRRTTRDRSELRTYRTADGGTVRSFAPGQNFADYSKHPRLTDDECGEIICAALTGKPLDGLEQFQRSMGQGTNSGGGWLCPDAISETVLDKARAKSRVLSAGTQTIAMTTQSLDIARVQDDPTFDVYGESQSIEFSAISFSGIALRARRVATAIAASRELIEDSPNAGTVIMDVLTSAMAAKIDDLLINGSGVGGEFMGLVNDPAIHETGSIGQLSYDDLLDAVGYVRSLNGEPNGVLLNPSTITWLNKLKTSTTLDYLSPPPALSAFPMLDTTAIANTTLIVGDFTQALFGLRQSLLIEMTNDGGDAFAKHETWIKATFRGGFNIARSHFERLEGLTY